MLKHQKSFYGNNNEEEEDSEKFEINRNLCPLIKTQITNILTKKIRISNLFKKLIIWQIFEIKNLNLKNWLLKNEI